MTQCFISVSGVKTTKDLGGLREVKMQSILVKFKKTNSSVTVTQLLKRQKVLYPSSCG